MITDRSFLIWLHERLVKVHGESELVDYMHRLRWIIENTPGDLYRPNVASTNGMDELLVKIERLDKLRAEPAWKRWWRGWLERRVKAL